MASRYWVGGSGNWTDTAHWSATNGGAGGASVPTLTDAAYIYGRTSEQIITLTTNASCNFLVIDTSNTGNSAGIIIKSDTIASRTITITNDEQATTLRIVGKVKSDGMITIKPNIQISGYIDVDESYQELRYSGGSRPSLFNITTDRILYLYDSISGYTRTGRTMIGSLIFGMTGSPVLYDDNKKVVYFDSITIGDGAYITPLPGGHQWQFSSGFSFNGNRTDVDLIYDSGDYPLSYERGPECAFTDLTLRSLTVRRSNKSGSSLRTYSGTLNINDLTIDSSFGYDTGIGVFNANTTINISNNFNIYSNSEARGFIGRFDMQYPGGITINYDNPVNFDYLQLNNSIIQGAATGQYNAGCHSLDLGGNVGWKFECPPDPTPPGQANFWPFH